MGEAAARREQKEEGAEGVRREQVGDAAEGGRSRDRREKRGGS